MEKRRNSIKYWIGVSIAMTALLVVGVTIFLGYWFKVGWLGFSSKTVWDWLNLLGVLAIPAVVGLGGAWYTMQQGKASEEAKKQRHEDELHIAEDNQRENALQAYIDKMSELLFGKKLHESSEDDEVRKIARVRTGR